jgi:transposase
MEVVVSADDSGISQIAQLRAENADLRQQIATLSQQLAWLQRQLFGQKSERRLIDNPDQLGLEALLGDAAPAAPAVPTQEIHYTRRVPKARDESCVTDEGLRFTADVPVEVIELPAPQLSGPDADQYEVIDHKVTRRLAQRPGSYVVLEYRRPVVKNKATATLREVAAPRAVFENSLADVSVLAGLLVDKFVYHLPLYRQHQRLADAGIALSRTTLTSYVQRAIDLLAPIAKAQHAHILKSQVLAMDETPIKAGRDGPGKLKPTWYWPLYGDADELSFTWSASRGSAHVKTQLQGFAGTLLTDGYAAYDAFAKHKPDVTQAQCWAHTRRHFERALDDDPAAHQALELIGALYRVEQQIRDRKLEGAAKLEHRSRHALPVVEAFFGWCYDQRQRVDLVTRAPFAKALVYADSRQAELRVYLGDPDVPIDTNHLERALRVIPMGRKNWLFCWTEVGAQHVGIIQSLLTTCRLQGVDPYTYLVDVLQRVSLHPARQVEDLTPRRWKDLFAAQPLRSDLHGLGQ